MTKLLDFVQLNRKIINGVIISALLALSCFFDVCSYITISYVAVVALFSTPQTCLELIFFTYPFQLVFKVDGTQFLYLYMVYGITAIMGIKYIIELIKKTKKINWWVLGACVIFVVYVALPPHNINLFNIVRYFMIYLLAYLVYEYRHELKFDKLLYSFCFGLALSMLFSLQKFYSPKLKDLMPNIIPYRGSNVYRYGALLGHPNHLSSNISMAVGALFVLMYTKQISKIWSLVLFAELTLFGYLSISKAFILMLAISFVIFAIFYIVKYKKEALIHVGMLVGVLIVVALSCFTITKEYLVRITYNDPMYNTSGIVKDDAFWQQVYNGQVHYDPGRIGIYKMYLTNWGSSITNILFGRGVSAPFVGQMSAHNIFIQLLWYHGIVGYLLYIAILWTMLNRNLKNLFSKTKIISVILLILPFVINLMVEPHTFTQVIIMYALIVAMINEQKQIKINQKESKSMINFDKIQITKQDKEKYKISVLTSVYKNDVASSVIEAFESILNQTYKPSEIVVVRDGPVGEELQKVLDSYKSNKIFSIYEREVNWGLGKTLAEGSTYCNYDYIARMDSDDIAEPTRFEKQVKCFIADPELGLVGTNGIEFVNTVDNVSAIKNVPETDEEIKEFTKSRCPFCHMSVMMTKQSLVDAGGYQDWYYAEDWYLWIRMCLAGVKFYNIQENLMQIRINEDTYARRHGMKYFKSINGLLKYMRKYKMIGFGSYLVNSCKRFVGHVLVPRKLKAKLYKKYMRKESE